MKLSMSEDPKGQITVYNSKNIKKVSEVLAEARDGHFEDNFFLLLEKI